MRFTFTSLLLFVSALSVGVTGCRDDQDDERYGTVSGLVFGIEQRTDPATGQTVTTAGYEYRFVGWRNFSNGRWVSNAYALGPDHCSEIALPDESATQHVGDGGRARFAGGGIPAEGLVVDANAPATTWSGAAFASNAPLVFDLESGYGVPRFGRVEVPVADVTLQVSEPAAGAEVTIDGSKDLRLSWSTEQRDEGRVFVVFEPDDRNVHLSCVFDEQQRMGVIESSFLRGAHTKGKLTIKTQRKIVVTPGDKWMIDVVTTNVVREQRFVVR